MSERIAGQTDLMYITLRFPCRSRKVNASCLPALPIVSSDRGAGKGPTSIRGLLLLHHASTFSRPKHAG